MKANTILFVQKLTDEDREIIRCLDDRRFTVEHMENMFSSGLDEGDELEALPAMGFLQAVRCLQKLGSAS